MILNRSYVHGGDIYSQPVTLDFSANVTPLGTPPEVKAAVIEAAERLSLYPDPYCGPLRQAIADRIGVGPESVLCGNGAAELIYHFAQALRPRRTLLPVPSFSDYEEALSAAGVAPEYHFLRRENGFLLTEGILSAITKETELLILCSPNNPTGRAVPRELLLEILDKCRQTGTWLFLDETFFELTDEATAFTLAGRLEAGDRVFLLRAFTKAYGMAGLRLGYGICRHPGMLEAMSRAGQPWNVSTLAQAAGLAALREGTWPQRTRALVAQEKPRLFSGLARLGLAPLPGAANFLLFSGPEELPQSLRRRGVLVRDCRNYRGLLAGDCRVAVRGREDNEALLAAMREVLHG